MMARFSFSVSGKAHLLSAQYSNRETESRCINFPWMSRPYFLGDLIYDALESFCLVLLELDPSQGRWKQTEPVTDHVPSDWKDPAQNKQSSDRVQPCLAPRIPSGAA